MKTYETSKKQEKWLDFSNRKKSQNRNEVKNLSLFLKKWNSILKTQIKIKLNCK
jgi:hypothetical protein